MTDTTASIAPAVPLSNLELAKVVLIAEREQNVAERALKALRADLLARMEAQGLTRIELDGEGLITFQASCTTHPTDAKACAVKIDKLGAQLQALRGLVWRIGEKLTSQLEWLGEPGVALAQLLEQLGTSPLDVEVPLGTTHRAASLRVTPRL